MAKGLGKGLGALMEDASAEQDDTFVSSAVTAAPVENNKKLPAGIEADENGTLWVNPFL